MRLEKMDSGNYGSRTYETAWKKKSDGIEVDYLKECIPFSGSEYLDLKNIIRLHKFRVNYRKLDEVHFFKEHEYSIHHLHVLAIEQIKYGKSRWLFLCDSKDLFCSLVEEFAAAFTSNKRVGSEEYSASRFWQ